MIIDDEIRDEKLLYDIAEKQLKISALSSGKIDRYEYLTGEEILPSNQRQITETNKNDSILKRKTEINKKKKLDNKKVDTKEQVGNNEILLSKEKEIFKNIYNKRLDKIDELSKTY